MTVIIFDKNRKVVAHKSYEVNVTDEKYTVLCDEFGTMRIYNYNVNDIRRMTIDGQTIIDVGE